MPRPLLACVPIALTCTATLADNCESIREQIESKIRVTGVSRFTLSIVEAGASAPGRVVGSCATGTRQIVYAAGTSAAASAGSAPSATQRARKPTVTSDIITECKDGSMSLGGECKN